MKFISAQEAIENIKSHNRVFIHSGVSTPRVLTGELVAQSARLENVSLYQIHTEWDCVYAEDKYRNSFNVYSFFNGANIRKAKKNINENKL